MKLYFLGVTGTFVAAVALIVSDTNPSNYVYATSAPGEKVFTKSWISCHGADGNSGYATDLEKYA